jgi:hypothetical protein
MCSNGTDFSIAQIFDKATGSAISTRFLPLRIGLMDNLSITAPMPR